MPADVFVTHAGTAVDARGEIVTDGGRVLSVTALGDTLADAQKKAYQAVACIRFTGMPSFSASLDDTQIWQLALFLKHMDSLPPSVRKVWTKLPSAGAGGN